LFTENLKIQKLKEIAKDLYKTCPAHDFEHIMRVYNLCNHLAENENIDIEVLQAATLLHDIGGIKEMNDSSGKTDHALEGAKIAEPILENLGFSEEKINHIKDCIISHRFKTENRPKTREAEILFDADKLDSLGAIGIARHISWVGRNNANIFKKVDDIQKYADDNLCGKINGRIQDKTKHSPQIEFEIKTKFLKDKLYTEKGREIAKERTEFFKNFLDRLERECNGEFC